MRRLSPSWMSMIFTALGGFVLLFVVAPIAGMVLATGPGDLAGTASDPEVTASVRLTLAASMAATALSAVAAVPFAWILARKEFPLKRLINGIIDLPIVIPHSAAGIALLGMLAPGSWSGALAERVGVRFVGGYAGIMAGMAYVSLPFLVNAARDGFAAVPQQLEKAALNLGASPLRVFMTISVPLAWRSIVSGMIMMWARGMSEFGAVLVIAYHPMITPVLIWERFGAFGLDYARPVAVMFIGVCLAFFVALRMIAVRRSDASSR